MSPQANKKLYVGSLPYTTTEDELRSLFEAYGPIDSVRIVVDKMTGRSKGFGFVEMTNAEDAKRAVEEMNGSQLGGRTLIVNDARPEQPRGERSFNGPRRDREGFGGDRPYRNRREY
jgi:RNA recognition motif-containing protein